MDTLINPTNNAEVGESFEFNILEACGIIPQFFEDACDAELKAAMKAADAGVRSYISLPRTLDFVASKMDELYQYGGFGDHPFDGEIRPDGTYQSDDEDPDMAPLAKFTCSDLDGHAWIDLFVYDYAICAIRNRRSGGYKIARFD